MMSECVLEPGLGALGAPKASYCKYCIKGRICWSAGKVRDFQKICDFFRGNFKFNFKFPEKNCHETRVFQIFKNMSGTRFVSRIRPSWGPRPLISTILGPLAMYWKCFQWFLESLTDGHFFNLDFAENFVSSSSSTTPDNSRIQL